MKTMAFKFTPLLVPFVSLVSMTSANDFLKVQPHEVQERVSKDAVRASLLEEIENSLGGNSASKHFSQLEAALQPIYAALPKNTHGNLDHTSASYALHRLFVWRHGWAIKGLATASGKYNASSPAGILKDQVPSYIEDLFDQRLGGKGFELHDLAVLAATIEHLVHDEANTRLQQAFKIHDAEGDNQLSEAEATTTLDTYMAAYVTSLDLATLQPGAAGKLRQDMPEIFSYWRQTQEFVHGVQKSFGKLALPMKTSSMKTSEVPCTDSEGSWDAQSLSAVAESVGEQFGSFFHEKVCLQLKSRLMGSKHNNGRIKLSEFYKPALDGFWPFQESVGFLREIGALEETEGQEASVMIANYLVAPSNCIATAGFYSVCCKNECEGLLGHLESRIAAPEAEVATIAALVTDLPSSSEQAPRVLSTSLLGRLNEIAKHHGGAVPLHSRLFAQWMHHAYPYECPYPHLAGTITSVLPDDWLDSGDVYMTTEDEMRKHVQLAENASFKVEEAEDSLQWSPEEELLVVRPPAGAAQPPWNSKSKPISLFSMVLFAVLVSIACGVVQAVKATHSRAYDSSEKFFV